MSNQKYLHRISAACWTGYKGKEMKISERGRRRF
jgi:hypothetical protein